jgi:hypothetical protein
MVPSYPLVYNDRGPARRPQKAGIHFLHTRLHYCINEPYNVNVNVNGAKIDYTETCFRGPRAVAAALALQR